MSTFISVNKAYSEVMIDGDKSKIIWFRNVSGEFKKFRNVQKINDENKILLRSSVLSKSLEEDLTVYSYHEYPCRSGYLIMCRYIKDHTFYEKSLTMSSQFNFDFVRLIGYFKMLYLSHNRVRFSYKVNKSVEVCGQLVHISHFIDFSSIDGILEKEDCYCFNGHLSTNDKIFSCSTLIYAQHNINMCHHSARSFDGFSDSKGFAYDGYISGTGIYKIALNGYDVLYNNEGVGKLLTTREKPITRMFEKYCSAENIDSSSSINHSRWVSEVFSTRERLSRVVRTLGLPSGLDIDKLMMTYILFKGFIDVEIMNNEDVYNMSIKAKDDMLYIYIVGAFISPNYMWMYQFTRLYAEEKSICIDWDDDADEKIFWMNSDDYLAFDPAPRFLSGLDILDMQFKFYDAVVNYHEN